MFVGVDGHKNTPQITVMDAAGKILKRQRVVGSPEHFRQKSLAEFSGPMKAVLEASYCWGHRQDQQQQERRENPWQKCGADFLDQVREEAGGIERAPMPNAFVLASFFTIFTFEVSATERKI